MNNIYVFLESEEYGREVFTYATIPEAQKGYDRLVKKARSQHDGVQRTLSLVLKWTRIPE